MSSPGGDSLLDHFAALKDPRQAWKVVYPLPELILLVLCAVIAGAEDCVEIRRWARLHLDFLRRFLPFAKGIPSHDTLNDILNALDPSVFTACFTNWVASLTDADPDIVAIDGKTSRRSHDHARGRGPLHLVSAWASRQRLVLGQQACAEKSNEITAIPLLLERLALRGCLVTIDAMGCQTKIARAILSKRADYLLAVKRNWASLHDEVKSAFDVQPPARRRTHTTIEGDHGRIETRHHSVIHDVSFMSTSRRFPGEPRFPGLRAIAMVESEVERAGKVSRETRYYLCSRPITAEELAHAVRSHWHVENRLHWVLDVVFRDDLSRMRTAHGPQNMAIFRHMALNALQQADDRHSIKVRRKSAAWDANYLEALITRYLRPVSTD